MSQFLHSALFWMEKGSLPISKSFGNSLLNSSFFGIGGLSWVAKSFDEKQVYGSLKHAKPRELSSPGA